MSTSIGVFIAMTKSREMSSALFDTHIGRSTILSRHREKSRSNSARAEAEMGGRLADLATRAAGLAIQDGLDLESHRKILDAVIREIASGREVAR